MKSEEETLDTRCCGVAARSRVVLNAGMSYTLHNVVGQDRQQRDLKNLISREDRTISGGSSVSLLYPSQQYNLCTCVWRHLF